MQIEKLYPACKEIVWGGKKLKEKYGKITDKDPCAESWELSFHKDGLTTLANGKSLAESVTAQELGKNTEGFPFFPTLIKFIDAEANLSVQVHPSDEYALQNENSFGKTETWYIIEAEQGAGIYLGFNRDVTKEEYEQAIVENRLTELLNFYEVKAGECYFIPSGTIHAIGKGCLICEIQQNSNLTYRVYDYGRVGMDGKPRELHVEKALKVTNLNRYEYAPVKANSADAGEVLAVSKYFTVKKYAVQGSAVLTADEYSFRCVTCVQGEATIESQAMRAGDSFFVPAGYGNYTVQGNADLVVSEVRRYAFSADESGAKITDDLGNILISMQNDGGRYEMNDLKARLLASVYMTENDLED